MALIVDGEIQVGVLGCPNLTAEEDRIGALLVAVKGQGSSIQPLFESGSSTTLSTTSVDTSCDAKLCESVESGHSDHSASAIIAKRLGIDAPSVRLDSQAKYAIVAQGLADIYMRLPSRPGYREKIWDHAAGVLQVTEAGGRVTDILGNDLDFGQGALLVEGRGVLATNGHLHDDVVEALRCDHEC